MSAPSDSDPDLPDISGPGSGLGQSGPAEQFLEGLKDQTPRADGPEPPPIDKAVIEWSNLQYRRGDGMGAIYEAFESPSGRKVAIKTIRPEFARSEAHLHRFGNETKVLAGLQHPNIVSLWSLGQDADGVPFFVMPWINGQTLEERLNSGDALRSLAKRLRSVCDAVHYAHSRGVWHGDLKPRNIMIGEFGEILVIDWGLAQIIPDLFESGERTAAGGPFSANDVPKTWIAAAGVGTKNYASPEQWKGGPVTPASDVYGLGIILRSILERAEPSLKITTRDLEAIRDKAARSDPKDRYPSAMALAEDLDRWLSGESVSARTPSPPERLGRLILRHPTWATVAAAGALVLGLLIAKWIEDRARSREWSESLITAEAEALPSLLKRTDVNRDEARARLDAARTGSPLSRGGRLRLELATGSGPMDPAELLKFELSELTVYRDLIARLPGESRRLVEQLRNRVREDREDRPLESACLLATLDPIETDSETWRKLGPTLAPLIIERGTFNVRDLPAISRGFYECRSVVIPDLMAEFAVRRFDRPERRALIALLSDWCDTDEMAAQLVMNSSPSEFHQLRKRLATFNSTRDREGAKHVWLDALRSPSDVLARSGVAAVGLILTGSADSVWEFLERGADLSVRAEIIHTLAAYEDSPDSKILDAMLARLSVDGLSPARRAALIQALGEFPEAFWADREPVRTAWAERLSRWHEADPDPEVHASLDWLLRRWGRGKDLESAIRRLAAPWSPAPASDWFVNSQGQTFIRFEAPGPFVIGSPPDEPDHEPGETRRFLILPRDFAICWKETTVGEYHEFAKQFGRGLHPDERRYAPTNNHPANLVRWIEAIAYCRWLSERDGVPESQQCYPPIPQILRMLKAKPDDLLALPPNDRERLGYRMATEAEWEYACRAGMSGMRPFGRSDERLGDYGWSLGGNLRATSAKPVGQLKPNPKGLFDMLGNVWEMTQDHFANPRLAASGHTNIDLSSTGILPAGWHVVVRGGSFASLPVNLRSANRHAIEPIRNDNDIGFRVARTLLPRLRPR